MVYLLFLFFMAAFTPASAPAPRAAQPVPPGKAVPVPAPRDSARAALEQGRFFRAAMLYRQQMRERGDTAPETLLGAATAAVGWGDWEGAEELLAGRRWLDDHPQAWAVLGEARFALEKWDGAADALRRAVAHRARLDADVAALSQARLAYALGQLDDHDAATREFDAAIAGLPQIGEWLGLFAAMTTARAGDIARTDARLGTVDAQIAREWGWRAAVDARANAGDSAAAIAAAERAAGTLESAARQAEAWQLAGTLRLERGDSAGARSAFRSAIAASAGSGAARTAARALASMGNLASADRLLVGRTLIRHGDFERGTPLLRAHLESGDASLPAAAREALRFELGDALFRGRQYREAERTLLELARTSTDAARAAAARFTAGRAQYRDGRQTEGRATFEQVAAQFPGEAGGVQALYFAADLLHDDEEYTRARSLYRRAVDAGRGDVEEVGLAAMRLAGMAWVDGDLTAARREWDAYLDRFPRGRVAQQALYWSARASAALGDSAAARSRMREALAFDPLSYYGALAADALGRAYPDLPLDAAPPRQHEATIAAALDGVDVLLRIGWTQAAAFEVERVRRRFSGNDATAYTLAEALNERGLTGAGVAIGRELQRRAGTWNPRLLRIVYPFPYRALIESEAERRNVDPFLAAGLIRQESLFNATAVSPAGAIGLMQVMPETGRAIAREIDIERFTPDMLRRAEVNVFLGMAYLADQLRSYGNRTDAVLGAYNAGPHRIQRWRQFPEWRHDELFAERIPFAETRGYVRIVQANARLYRALYGS